jgi:ectoine hydroxylase-related dioxygenase (phytanoyl-CoA dioxygenase family)
LHSNAVRLQRHRETVVRTELSADEIERYRRDGFLKYSNFLSQAEVDELKAAMLGAISSMGRRKVAGDGADFQEGDAFYDRVFTQRLNLWRIDDVVRSYIARPELGRMLCELEGVEGVRVWHDQGLIKEPYANPTAFHIDVPYWSFFSRQAISIWIALEDATPSNGCLCFVPGSHRITSGENAKIGENFGDLMRIYPALQDIDPVMVPMRAGDCSFHNALTAHAAGPNMTRGRRVAMSCAYMPQGCTFNGRQSILSERYAASLSAGDVLDDDGQNPLVYQMTE